ncbi:hypothetical protein, partial [Dubosiella newyorkensis]
KGMTFLSVRSFTLTNSELITKKTIYTKILTLPHQNNKNHKTHSYKEINKTVPFFQIHCLQTSLLS